MIELLSPAGSPEGLRAAVQNGADAVYLGLKDFNARRGAKNFSPDEFAQCAEYCRVRGVKVYLTLNTLVTDREFETVIERARLCARLGADAFIVTDLGLVRALRRVLPDIPLHASTQMGIHSLEGAKLAAAMGISRVILARELPRSEIEYISKNTSVETEVFVHGALCMSYSGQCYFSAMLGGRSGNRGMCAQPCRLPYGGGSKGDEYPLSLRDNCLVSYIGELEQIGVKCIKIEGRMKRPEYTAVTTRVYSRAIRGRKAPSEEDMRALEAAFSRGGFTDGYYKKRLGADMFGIRAAESADSELFRAVRNEYMKDEYQRVPVRFIVSIREGRPARLIASDDRKNIVTAASGTPEPAFHRELTPAALATQLHKTGGTPFICRGVRSKVDHGLTLPVKDINEMRRTALSGLLQKRRALAPPREGVYKAGKHQTGRAEPPVFTVSVMNAEQLSQDMLELKPAVVYIPSEELKKISIIRPFLQSPHTTVAVTLPRVLPSEDTPRLEAILKAAKKAGITEALCTNQAQIPMVRMLGLKARGDFGLNLFNSHSVRAASELGLISATLSFELNLAQIRDISKPIDTELMVYGRLPMMLTENCVIKLVSGGVCNCENFRGLSDRRGVTMPVLRESGCRNVIFNSQKLFMADRLYDLQNIGIWAQRLYFTTENARECAAVFRRYLEQGEYEPGGFTRGMYYKGVE